MHQNYGFINQKLYGWKCECKYGAILINKNETQTSGEKAWEMSAASICSHYRIVSTLRRAKRNLCYGLCILYVFSTMYFRIKWAHMKSLLVVQSALKGWNWVIVAFLALSKMLFFFFFFDRKYYRWSLRSVSFNLPVILRCWGKKWENCLECDL